MNYYSYSQFLIDQYGKKVYKLPVNLPVTCPNRDGVKGTGGCIFCSDIGAGFEACSEQISIADQLMQNYTHINQRYNAQAYIAYFQNFTNTYMPVHKLESYMNEAIEASKGHFELVEISISTRPDCISPDQLDMLCRIQQATGIVISIELGLQSLKSSTLKKINRGHDLADFIYAAMQIKSRGLQLGVHLIPNLPWDSIEDVVEAARMMSALNVDTVKLHSLYILKETPMALLYENDSFKICSEQEYYERVMAFIQYLGPNIAIQRFFGRAPQDQTLFCNWGRSWRYLQNELEKQLSQRGIKQGALLKWSVSPHE